MKKYISVYHLCSLLLLITSTSFAEDREIKETNGYERSSKNTTDAIHTAGSLNVMTFNILWDKETSGQTQWSHRKQGVINLLKRHNPDIILF